MIQEFKAPGTILFGKAMAAQLVSELAGLNVKKPLIITRRENISKARKIGRMLTAGFYDSIEISTDDNIPSVDCLILAGGKDLTDRFFDDPRHTVHFPLSPDHLKELTEPGTDVLVVDRALLGKKEIPADFFSTFTASVTGGRPWAVPSLILPDSFTYHGRTIVINGDEALTKLPEILSKKEVSKPLILTDQGIISVGLLDFVKTSIEPVKYSLFSDIPPDSRIDVVNRISDFYKEEKCDGIIAFGGGSVLDTGKGVYLNVSLGVEDLNCMVGSGHIPRLNTPFIAIPTTSGTGSEVTKVAVVSDPERMRKMLFNSDNLQPDFAILDSRLTASLPPFLTSITGVDALTHAVEAYTCLGKNPLSDHQAWTAIELIRDHLIGAVDDSANLKHRRSLALASNLAGSAFSNSMVGMVHTIGHSIGSVCHAAHGSCMSVLLPHALEYNFSAIESYLAELLIAVAGRDIWNETAESDRAGRTIEEIKKLNRILNEKTGGRHPETLRDLKDREGRQLVSPDLFEKIAKTAMGDASIVYNPVELRVSDVMAVLKKAW